MNSNQDLQFVAIVPMRHHSVRVPEKNYRDFAGKPLFFHVIKQLEQCPRISRVVIDTDSPRIRDLVEGKFDRVQVIERPVHLREDTVPMHDVLLNSVNQFKAHDFFLQTHSTNPLLKAETIAKALETFQRNFPLCDSLFSVTRVQARLWDELKRPVNHNADILMRTQDLPPIYEENSNLYIFTRETLEKYHNRIGKRPLMFEMDKMEATDIDTELDFKLAEVLYEMGVGSSGE